MTFETKTEIEKENRFSQLKLLRDSNNFDNIPFFSDENLKQILESIEGYHQIYEQSSEQAQRLLLQEDFSKSFLLSVLGVYPTRFLAEQEDANVDIALPYDQEILETDDQEAIIKELDELLKQYLPKLRLITIDQEKAKNRKGFTYEIVNMAAINKVFQQNQDVFPIDQDPIRWLMEGPEKESKSANANYPKIVLNDIRAGLLSGFPRKDCEIFAEEVAKWPIFKDMFKSIKNILLGKKDEPRWKEPPFENLNEFRKATEYRYIVFSEDGYQWLEAAYKLMNELKSMGMILANS